jgi:hypothetical protein
MTGHVTDENQLSTADGRRYAHEDCGLACALSMALDAGLPDDETVASMEAWYAAHGDSSVDGTGTAVNAAWLTSEGLNATVFAGTMDMVDNFLDHGWRVQLAIYSNSYGTPYSGPGCFGHFVELCWRDAGSGTYHVMQPVGGVEVTYTRQQLVDNSQDAGVVVQHDYRTSTPSVTPIAGITSGGQHLVDPQAVAAVIKNTYVTAMLARTAEGKGPFTGRVLQQEVNDPAGFNAQVNAVVSGQRDLHAVVNEILSSVVNAK